MPTADPFPELTKAAATAGEDIDAALRLSADWGTRLPLPASGATASRWAVLAALGRVNLTVARVFEAHTDALAILAEAGQDVPTGTAWGVFAAEAAGVRLDAQPSASGVSLVGTKPWCSLGGRLDAALVTAHVGAHSRQLFRVDLRHETVTAEPAHVWVARGLRTVTSAPVHFAGTPAQPVGDPGWYLTRPGFAWGGVGVAACWLGGAQGVADAIRQRAAQRGGDLDALHLGIVDVTLHAADAVLDRAAREIDAGAVDDPEVLALRCRSVVADAAERVLLQAGHALGPAPLAFDAEYAARVADLQLYVRQHHAERDLAELGKRLRGREGDR